MSETHMVGRAIWCLYRRGAEMYSDRGRSVPAWVPSRHVYWIAGRSSQIRYPPPLASS